MPTSKQIGKGLALGVDREGKRLPRLTRRCPFCRGPAQWKAALHPSPKFPYAVECIQCWASTAFFKLAKLAAAAWNRRAP